MEHPCQQVQEIEVKIGTLATPEAKDALIGFLVNQEEIRKILITQWDMCSKETSDQSGFTLNIDTFPELVREKIKSVFPDISPKSKLRIRCKQEENKEAKWTLEEKNAISFYKTKIKQQNSLLVELKARLDNLKKKKRRKLEKTIEGLETKIRKLETKNRISDTLNERTFELTENNIWDIFNMGIEEFFQEISAPDIITGVTEKIRFQIEKTGFFLEAMKHIFSKNSITCDDAVIDIALNPHDGKYLVRLELEFETTEQLDVFLDYASQFLKAINAVLAFSGVQFSIPQQKEKGQRTIAIEQYATIPPDAHNKTPWKFYQLKTKH